MCLVFPWHGIVLNQKTYAAVNYENVTFCTLKIIFELLLRIFNQFNAQNVPPKTSLLWIAYYYYYYYYYYYSCNSCNDIYYCKTKYHFCVRPANHKGVFTSYKESCRNIKQSTVLNHVTAHNFNKRG